VFQIKWQKRSDALFSDNFVLKNHVIHEIVMNGTPERQKLMFGRSMGERNFDWLNNEERTGLLIMLNNYVFLSTGWILWSTWNLPDG